MKIRTLLHKGFGPIVEDKFRRVGTSLISGSLLLAGQAPSHDTELHLYAHVCIGTAKLVSLLSPRNFNMQYNFIIYIDTNKNKCEEILKKFK